jgi:hypothetical protein
MKDLNKDSVVQGDNGSVLRFTINNKNLTGATVQVNIRRGSEMFTKNATIVDAIKGICEVVLNKDDLTIAGVHFLQPTVTYTDATEFTSDLYRFAVKGNLTYVPTQPNNGGTGGNCSTVKDSATNGNIVINGSEVVVYDDATIRQLIGRLDRVGISVNGKITIDDVEQIGGGSEEMTLVVKDYFEGSTNVTKTYADSMIGFEIANDAASGGANLTFTINSLTIPVKAGEVYSGNFDPYKTVAINTAVPFRATVSSSLSGTVTPTPSDTTPPTVAATPNGGTFTSSLSVTLTANETATIYYSLDGSTPTTSSSVYSTPISIPNSVTLKFFAKDTAGNSSAIQSTVFTINIPDTTPPTVSASPAGGTYTGTQNITLSANETATIYYTIDGSTPTTSSAIYSAPIAVSSSATLKYFAKDTAGNSSQVQSQVYTINIPDTTPPNNVTNLATSGVTQTGVTLTWTASNSNDIASYDIYNGATFVTNVTGTTYNVSGLSASTQYTFNVKSKDASGNVASGTSVTVTTSAPVDTTPPIVTASPVGGTFTSAQSVTLSANETATIYYTTDGSTPTTSSAVYSTPLNVNATTTVKYFAKDTAGNSSSISTQTYTINVAGVVLVSDDFNRADSTTAIGTATTGQTWTALNGTWGISSNQAYLTANVGGAIAVVDSGQANCEVEVVYSITNVQSKVICRASTLSNYIVFNSDGTLSKVVNGSFTTLGTMSPAPSLASGDIIKITLNGNNITAKVNDGAKGSVLTVTDTFNNTITKHGIGAANTTSRFDNFKITTI